MNCGFIGLVDWQGVFHSMNINRKEKKKTMRNVLIHEQQQIFED